MERVGAEIKNQPQFMAEATKLLNSDDTKEKSSTASQPSPVLSNVKITGNHASGTATYPANQKASPIYFIKENDSWLLSSKPIPQELE